MAETKQAVVAEAHQPGQDVFRSILPDDIDWKPFAAFPLRPIGRSRRRAFKARPLYDQGQSASWRKADAASSP